ncbi:MAG: TVP38/TMEM64 family protein [Pseudomonadota bacterium]
MSVGMNETSTEKTAPSDLIGRAKRFIPAVLVVLFLVTAWLAGWFDYFSLSNLIMNREELATYAHDHQFFAMAIYALIYTALVAISFPGASLLTVAAGFVFGGLAGGLLTVFAATAGSVIIFSIARSSFGDFLAKKAGPFISKMVDGFNRDAFNYLLMIRLTPIFPFWVVNIVPALLNVRLLPYAIATFLGIIPGTFAYSFVGAGLGSVIEAQEAANPGCADAGTCEIDPSSLVTPQIIWAMLGLAAISILPIVIRKFWAAKAADPS